MGNGNSTLTLDESAAAAATPDGGGSGQADPSSDAAAPSDTAAAADATPIGPSDYRYKIVLQKPTLEQRNPAQVPVCAIIDNSLSMGHDQNFCLGQSFATELFEMVGPYILLTLNRGGTPTLEIPTHEEAEKVNMPRGDTSATNIQAELEKLVAQLNSDSDRAKDAEVVFTPRPVILLLTDGQENVGSNANHYMDNLTPEQRALFNNARIVCINIGDGAVAIGDKLSKLGLGGDFDKVNTRLVRLAGNKREEERAKVSNMIRSLMTRHIQAQIGVESIYREGMLASGRSPLLCELDSQKGLLLSFIDSNTELDDEETAFIYLDDICKNEASVIQLTKQLLKAKGLGRTDFTYSNGINRLLADILAAWSKKLAADGLTQEQIRSNHVYRNIISTIIYSPTFMASLTPDQSTEWRQTNVAPKISAGSFAARAEDGRAQRAAAYSVPPLLRAAANLMSTPADQIEQLRRAIQKILGDRALRNFDHALYELNIFRGKQVENFDIQNYLELLLEGDTDEIAQYTTTFDMHSWKNTAQSIQKIILELVAKSQSAAQETVQLIRAKDGTGDSSMWASFVSLNKPAALPVELEGIPIKRVFFQEKVLHMLSQLGFLPLVGAALLGQDPALAAYQDASAYHGLIALAILNSPEAKDTDTKAMAWIYRMHLGNTRDHISKLCVKFRAFRAGSDGVRLGQVFQDLHGAQELFAYLISPQLMAELDWVDYKALWNYAKLFLLSDINKNPEKRDLLTQTFESALAFANRIYHFTPELSAEDKEPLEAEVATLYTSPRQHNENEKMIVYTNRLAPGKPTSRFFLPFAAAHMQACGNEQVTPAALALEEAEPVHVFDPEEDAIYEEVANDSDDKKELWHKPEDFKHYKDACQVQAYAKSIELSRAISTENSKWKKDMDARLLKILREAKSDADTERLTEAQWGEVIKSSIPEIRNTPQFSLVSTDTDIPGVTLASLAAMKEDRTKLIQVRNMTRELYNDELKDQYLKKLAGKHGLDIAPSQFATLNAKLAALKAKRLEGLSFERESLRIAWMKNRKTPHKYLNLVHPEGDRISSSYLCLGLDFLNVSPEGFDIRTMVKTTRTGRGVSIPRKGGDDDNGLIYAWRDPAYSAVVLQWVKTIRYELKEKATDSSIKGHLLKISQLDPEKQLVFLELLRTHYGSKRIACHRKGNWFCKNHLSFDHMQTVIRRLMPSIAEPSTYCKSETSVQELMNFVDLMSAPANAKEAERGSAAAAAAAAAAAGAAPVSERLANNVTEFFENQEPLLGPSPEAKIREEEAAPTASSASPAAAADVAASSVLSDSTLRRPNPKTGGGNNLDTCPHSYANDSHKKWPCAITASRNVAATVTASRAVAAAIATAVAARAAAAAAAAGVSAAAADAAAADAITASIFGTNQKIGGGNDADGDEQGQYTDEEDCSDEGDAAASESRFFAR